MGCGYSNLCNNDRSFQVPWSDLPTDVLRLIAGKYLNTIDRNFISGVCRSWRSAVKESSYDKDLWILFPDKTFLSCRSKQKYRSLLPITRKGSDWKCLGFSKGWLVMQTLETISCFGPPIRHTCLFNPFNGDHISLPETEDYLARCVVNSLTSRDEPRVVYGIIDHGFSEILTFTIKEIGGVGFKEWVPVEGLHPYRFLNFHEDVVYTGNSGEGILRVYRIDLNRRSATLVL